MIMWIMWVFFIFYIILIYFLSVQNWLRSKTLVALIAAIDSQACRQKTVGVLFWEFEEFAHRRRFLWYKFFKFSMLPLQTSPNVHHFCSLLDKNFPRRPSILPWLRNASIWGRCLGVLRHFCDSRSRPFLRSGPRWTQESLVVISGSEGRVLKKETW